MPKEYVVDGASLECGMGDSSATLAVLPLHRVKLTDKLKANIGDCAPFVNVPPFGQCQSMANPAVAAATAANYGKLTPVPCTPACSSWIPSKTDYLLDGMNPLMDSDKALCPLGAAMIKVTDSGQGDSKEGEKKVEVDNATIDKPERPPPKIPKPPQVFGLPPQGSADGGEADCEANTPIDGNGGSWAGARGDSVWYPDRRATPEPKKKTPQPYNNPDNLTWGGILDKYGIEGVPYVKGEPEFGKLVRGAGDVSIDDFTGDRKKNFKQADIKMAEAMSEKLGRPVEPGEVAQWREDNGYTWHERRNETMQKVPHEVHANISHSGGVSKYLKTH